jgi:hypothetical protein
VVRIALFLFIAVAALSPALAQDWSASFPKTALSVRVAEAHDGGLILAGFVDGTERTPERVVARFSPLGELECINGRRLTEATLNNNTVGLAVAPNGDFSVGVTFTTNCSGCSSRIALVLRYRSDGELLWNRGLERAIVSDLAIAPSGNTVVTGWPYPGVGSPFVHEFAEDGTTVSARSYHRAVGPDDKLFFSTVSLTPDGDLFVGGWWRSSYANTRFVSRVRPDGSVAWVRRITDAGGGSDSGLTMKALADGTVAVHSAERPRSLFRVDDRGDLAGLLPLASDGWSPWAQLMTAQGDRLGLLAPDSYLLTGAGGVVERQARLGLGQSIRSLGLLRDGGHALVVAEGGVTHVLRSGPAGLGDNPCGPLPVESGSSQLSEAPTLTSDYFSLLGPDAAMRALPLLETSWPVAAGRCFSCEPGEGLSPDGDGDDSPDLCDVCPDVPDDQADADDDGFGDACDVCPDLPDDQLDRDRDAVGDACDVCPEVPDRRQFDRDADGIGDACDDCTDPDGDGWGDPDLPGTCPPDLCPDDADALNEDSDGDGIGDVCDGCPADFDDGSDADGDDLPDACDSCPDVAGPGADSDGDGVDDACDVCPGLSDPLQENRDRDALGDACDSCPEDRDDGSDGDGDGVPDACDVCPADDDPLQADGDGDGVGDACDACSNFDPAQADCDSDGVPDACSVMDSDGDGLRDDVDACPCVDDPAQLDADGDGVGDVCDVCPLVADPVQADADGDGIGDACDPLDEPSALDLRPADEPLRISRDGLGTLRLTWQDTGAPSYDLQGGFLSRVEEGARLRWACDLPTADASLAEEAGDHFYLVVARHGSLESSGGRDSSGVERSLGAGCP